MPTNMSGPQSDKTTTSSDYERGYQQGFTDAMASAQTRIEAVERQADYWYFKANNPGVPTSDERVVEDIIRGREENERREKVYAELDRVENEAKAEARRLIAETDMTDVAIASKVGLFAPMIENMRAGLL